jgi:histone acetyltransferase (RNA polymerase elongator complex component)
VQHTDDRILKKINRDCYFKDTVRAIKNLKDVCLKVDIHLMPQLPGASQQDDEAMFYQIIHNSDLQADQLKIYPCETTPWTKIEKWFLEGSYQPYPNEDMQEIVMNFLTKINPWMRINRTGRDALPSYAIAGNPIPNLGQIINDNMKKKGMECRCIRCREVGSKPDRMARIDEAVLMVRQYDGSDGTDYFLSFETPDEKVIFGFCRLRLSTNAGYVSDIIKNNDKVNAKKEKENGNEKDICVNAVPVLNDCAFIRELHVYGRVNRVNDNTRNGTDVQHRGFGRMLIAKAEEIAYKEGYTKMAIISGVGVREYYRKFGYELEDAYMTKELINNNSYKINDMDNQIIDCNFKIIMVCIIVYFLLQFYNSYNF